MIEKIKKLWQRLRSRSDPKAGVLSRRRADENGKRRVQQDERGMTMNVVTLI